MKQLYTSVLAAGILLASSVHAQAPAYEWTRTLYNTSSSYTLGEGGGNSIATDASGNVYTTGWFVDVVDFDPGPGVAMQGSMGQGSMFVLKLDAQGNFVWARAVVPTQNTMYAKGTSLAVDAAGNVYAAGAFRGTIDFDPGAGVFNLTSTGPRDVYALKLDPQGNFVWAGAISGAYVELPRICVSAQGHAHLTGYYSGTLDADPGAGVTPLVNPSNNFPDFFIIKLDVSGNLLWAHTIGSSSSDFSTSINVDMYNNVYVTGAYNGTVDFDPGAGVSNLTSVGSGDVFILKLDPQGNFAWVRSVGGTSADISATVLPDQLGNLYVSGLFKGTCDFDPGAGTYNLTSVDWNGDQFVLKLAENGSFVWVVQLTLEACGENFNLALDPSGNPYLAGNFKDSGDFDPGPGAYMLYPSSPATASMFVLKLNTSGIFQWAVEVSGNDMVYAECITIGSDYSVFTYGYYFGTPDFDPGIGTDYIPAGGPIPLFIHKMKQTAPTGVSENNPGTTVSVYPNPGSGNFQLNSGGANISALEVYTVAGQKVFSCSPNSSAYTLDLQAQPAGMYFVRMLIDGKPVQEKLVKE